MNTTDQFVKHLAVPDYLVLCSMLVVSAGIGIYFGCFGKKLNNTKDYLLGGKSVGMLPVTASLGVSYMSAVTLLGGPSEVYQNGLIYVLIVLAFYLTIPIVMCIFLPVFWNLQLMSVYEYLERRFNKKIRMLASTIFLVQMTIYMAIATYAPALALSHMTPLTVYTSVSVMIVISMFYTALGGIKAVLWTDVIQAVIMYSCLLYVYIKGTMDTGGLEYVWNKSNEGGRTNLVDWDPTPTKRHTFWTLVIGVVFNITNSFGVTQIAVQRYLCLPNKRSVIIALILGITISMTAVLLSAYGGLIIYARYGDCDPVQTGRITKHDQLLPLFAMDILGKYPGLPGLLIAGIFSASLSTVSSGLNSLTASTLEDYVKKIFPLLSDERATFVSKGLSIAFGVLTFGLVVLVERLGNILEVSISIYGMLSGPHLGLFTLGMVFPWTNCIGAAVGALTGLVCSLWVGLGYRIALLTGRITPKRKVFSTYGCNFTDFDDLELNVFNDTLSYQTTEEDTDILAIYYLSYLWLCAFGFLVTVVVGLLVSFLTGATKLEDINPRYLSPLTRKLLPKIRNSEFDDKELANLNTTN